jgi:ATP-binding cassette subfamily F protein uup
MLDRVSTTVLGLDGRGNAATFADYSQWEQWIRQTPVQLEGPAAKSDRRVSDPQPATGKKKLSYLEAREYATIEEKVEAADGRVRAAHAAIEDPKVAIDANALTAALRELEEAQAEADELYARWAELTEKAG